MFEFSFPRYGTCIGVKVTADPAWMQSLPAGLVLSNCQKADYPKVFHRRPAEKQQNN
jgi:hypothetical protein